MNIDSLNDNCKIETPERNRVAYAPWFLSFFVLFDQLSDVWDFKLTVIVMPCDEGKQQMSGKTGIYKMVMITLFTEICRIFGSCLLNSRE